MRVIAGKYGGRIIKSPNKKSTHPMSEKMRGALFNALGDIEGLSLFDAYAGSGAVGIEALSRGAKYVLFTDKDRQAVTVIKENLNNLNTSANNYHLSEANCVSYIENQPQEFDIIVTDPPYDDLKVSQLEVLSKYIKDGGLMVVSCPTLDVNIDGFRTIQTKSYGDSNLVFMIRG